MAKAAGATNQGLSEALRVDVRPRFAFIHLVCKELGEKLVTQAGLDVVRDQVLAAVLAENRSLPKLLSTALASPFQ